MVRAPSLDSPTSSLEIPAASYVASVVGPGCITWYMPRCGAVSLAVPPLPLRSLS